MLMDKARVAQFVLDQVPAMVAYWDYNERCVFANSAYQVWFGRKPEEMPGITLRELLGPLYLPNLPHIQAALRGEPQAFERRIPLPDGTVRESLATYTPHVVHGNVWGFTAHVADATDLASRERALKRTIAEVIEVLARTKQSFRSKELGALRLRLEQLSRG